MTFLFVLLAVVAVLSLCIIAAAAALPLVKKPAEVATLSVVESAAVAAPADFEKRLDEVSEKLDKITELLLHLLEDQEKGVAAAADSTSVVKRKRPQARGGAKPRAASARGSAPEAG